MILFGIRLCFRFIFVMYGFLFVIFLKDWKICLVVFWFLVIFIMKWMNCLNVMWFCLFEVFKKYLCILFLEKISFKDVRVVLNLSFCNVLLLFWLKCWKIFLNFFNWIGVRFVMFCVIIWFLRKVNFFWIDDLIKLSLYMSLLYVYVVKLFFLMFVFWYFLLIVVMVLRYWFSGVRFLFSFFIWWSWFLMLLFRFEIVSCMVLRVIVKLFVLFVNDLWRVFLILKWVSRVYVSFLRVFFIFE